MLPILESSSVDNVAREIIHCGGVLPYTIDKIDLLKENNPELLNLIESLSESVSCNLNRIQCIAICVAVVNSIQTQCEIDWLKGE